MTQRLNLGDLWLFSPTAIHGIAVRERERLEVGVRHVGLRPSAGRHVKLPQRPSRAGILKRIRLI
jgi:hypothetical protein